MAGPGDPLLRELETYVVRCVVSQSQAAPAGKKSKKAVLAPTLPDAPVLEVILHDTVIFPEGGGQPTDTGKLKTVDGIIWDVVQAKRHGGHAVHFVRVPSSTSVDAALLTFSPGAKVTAMLDAADWDRRYDHVSACCSIMSPPSHRHHADVNAYIPTSAVGSYGDQDRSSDTIVVVNDLSEPLLCGSPSWYDCG